jgi:hypothetical protein
LTFSSVAAAAERKISGMLRVEELALSRRAGESVIDRHADVHQDQVRPHRLRLAIAILSIACHVQPRTMAQQEVGEQHAIFLGVVDDQDALPRQRPGVHRVYRFVDHVRLILNEREVTAKCSRHEAKWPGRKYFSCDQNYAVDGQNIVEEIVEKIRYR